MKVAKLPAAKRTLAGLRIFQSSFSLFRKRATKLMDNTSREQNVERDTLSDTHIDKEETKSRLN